MSERGCCTVGLGGPYVVPPSGLMPGDAHPWHIAWLPHGYATTRDDFVICVVAQPPGWDWSGFTLKRGGRPPLIEAICSVIEGTLLAGRPSEATPPLPAGLARETFRRAALMISAWEDSDELASDLVVPLFELFSGAAA